MKYGTPRLFHLSADQQTSGWICRDGGAAGAEFCAVGPSAAAQSGCTDEQADANPTCTSGTTVAEGTPPGHAKHSLTSLPRKPPFYTAFPGRNRLPTTEVRDLALHNARHLARFLTLVLWGRLVLVWAVRNAPKRQTCPRAS